MADIDTVVSVTVSRDTQTVTQAGFGTPGIIAKFATTDTTIEFDRYRTYASLTEMATDGWASGDAVYDAAAAIFAQSPTVSQVFVGRWDSGDASLSAALTAIQIASPDWYTFSVVGQKVLTLEFSGDLVTDNDVDVTINGTAITQVPFNTDHATTMAAIETQIESDISGAVATVSGTYTITVALANTDVFGSAVVSGGASQVTVDNYSEADETSVVKAAAAWAETNKKIFFFGAENPDVKNSAVTDDIVSDLQDLNYARTVPFFRDANGNQYAETAWPGECLPFDPGSQTWAYKTLVGVTADGLTSSASGAVFDKSGNTYQSISGVSVTRYGTAADGSYIDETRGLDWLESEIQTEVFTKLINARKIPFNDEGIQLIEGALAAALDAGVQNGLLTEYTITVPKYEDISLTDRGNRLLPDVTFTAVLAGAIHKVVINGSVVY